MPFFQNIREDLKTYEGEWGRQGFWVMIVYRFGRWRYGIGNRFLRKPLSLIYRIAFKTVQILTGIEFPCEVEIGRNFRIDHFGGIIVSGYTRFGDNCIIRNGVTIGLRRLDEVVAPTIGNNVNIGTGAKILGAITIGDDVDIGANAVVIRDVPAHSIAVGVPAKVYPKKGESEHISNEA